MQQVIDFLQGTDITANTVEVLASVVLALAAWWLKSHTSEKIKASRFGAVYDSILAGASETYQTLYKDMKARAADGVLSRADIGKLSEEAYRQAVRVAGDSRTKQALHNMAEQEWTRLLQKAVGQLKAEGSGQAAA